MRESLSFEVREKINVYEVCTFAGTNELENWCSGEA